MADIRYSTAVIDDFERPNETPAQLPWKRDYSDYIDCNIAGGAIKSSSGLPSNNGQMYWSTESFTGDDIEGWAAAVGNATQSESYRLGLVSSGDGSARHGYICLMQNPVGDDVWRLDRLDGTGFSNIAISAPEDLPTSGMTVLMQTTATHVSMYKSFDNGDTWTQVLTAADNTYRTELYIHLGANGGAPAWEYFGGGTEDDIVQIYRRPNE